MLLECEEEEMRGRGSGGGEEVEKHGQGSVAMAGGNSMDYNASQRG
ncbi:MAG: hypothetical protein NTU53_06890 [Planctomycetota bacterium]|nr:hypothetical protein [Planctomycetota bacterium]